MTRRSAFVLRVRPEKVEEEVSRGWQDHMARLLEERVPDAGPPPLEEIFRLD